VRAHRRAEAKRLIELLIAAGTLERLPDGSLRETPRDRRG
jgi:hypothetical protein